MLSSLPSNPLFIPVVILGIIVIVLIILVTRLHLRIKRFLVGLGSENVDESLRHIADKLEKNDVFRAELETYLEAVEKRLKKSVQAVHTVRFNPFKGTGEGGNQSFATAFLTEDGDGVIISSLYSREHVSVFGKPVKKLVSEHTLSDEEKEALDTAVTKLK